MDRRRGWLLNRLCSTTLAVLELITSYERMERSICFDSCIWIFTSLLGLLSFYIKERFGLRAMTSFFLVRFGQNFFADQARSCSGGNVWYHGLGWCSLVFFKQRVGTGAQYGGVLLYHTIMTVVWYPFKTIHSFVQKSNFTEVHMWV
jgi:hypothetical protein